jgi:histone acetyltransferase
MVAVLQSRKVNYMITYGDNMALGFFRKQGFSEKITMPR